MYGMGHVCCRADIAGDAGNGYVCPMSQVKSQIRILSAEDCAQLEQANREVEKALFRKKADAAYVWMTGNETDAWVKSKRKKYPVAIGVSPAQMAYAKWCMDFDPRVASNWIVSKCGLMIVKMRSWEDQLLLEKSFDCLAQGDSPAKTQFDARWSVTKGFDSNPSFNSTARHYKHLRANTANDLAKKKKAAKSAAEAKSKNTKKPATPDSKAVQSFLF